MRTRCIQEEGTMKGIWVSSAVALAILAVISAAAFNDRQGLNAKLSERIVDGALLTAGVSNEQGQALLGFSETPAPYEQLLVTHPPVDAIYPHSFPPVRIQWSDQRTGRLYRVVVKSGDTVLFRGVTDKHEIHPHSESWDTLKSAGGRLDIEISSARVAPNGQIQSDVTTDTSSKFTLAPEADNPTGMLLFGAKHRPADKPLGTVSLLTMHLQIEGLDLEKMEHRILFRSSEGPQPTQVHPGRMERERGGGRPGDEGPDSNEKNREDEGGGDKEGPGNNDPHAGGDTEITSTQCVSCHALSSNGEYIAVFSQAAEEAPPEFDAPNGFLTVLKMPERKILIQLPHAFMPQFNPKDPNLLAFGQVDETIGVKDQMMVRKSDIHVLDLTTGKHQAVPGAAKKDRVENLPYWSPDGKRITFIRTKPGQMWHGAAGHLDLAWVEYNDGKGSEAHPLTGGSNNNRSNFLPVYSPDGKWIVFTQADQGFFSQESSDLYIVPSDGGKARRMNCNSSHTESWHRFSPDGKWMAVVTNREDIRRPHIYLSRFNTQDGTCTPAVQMPAVAGMGAHTHAFSWTRRFDWLTQYERINAFQ
ncbi:MAG TPA: hypothetical protein EYN06_02735 [Myxococcales bacterium]|nr:hypothetical protein [Myxococcales bacterium]